VIAVILVGGEGTRLRPLTEQVPKPMVPIANRPFLEHQIAQLERHGITDVVLSCGYLPDQIRDHFGDRLRYVVEDFPLGTGGAIEHAAREFSETFLVCNGDVLTDLDVTDLIALHRAKGARATIALHPVDDPTRYGLVRTDDEGAVTAFIEKPAPGEADVNTINAGTYVMEPDVLRLIPPATMVSVEREVFPHLVGDGLYARSEPGEWIDIGTPASYLAANMAEMPDGGLIDLDAQIDPSAEVVDSVVGPGTVVAAGARVERSVLLPGSVVGEGARIVGRVIGRGFEW
jgi:mannose-1-phosphate guanylyltransferase